MTKIQCSISTREAMNVWRPNLSGPALHLRVLPAWGINAMCGWHPACLRAWGVRVLTRVWACVSRGQHLRAWRCKCRGAPLVGLTRGLNRRRYRPGPLRRPVLPVGIIYMGTLYRVGVLWAHRISGVKKLTGSWLADPCSVPFRVEMGPVYSDTRHSFPHYSYCGLLDALLYKYCASE